MSSDYKARYKKWLSDPHIDEETKKELVSIKEDEEGIKDRFYQSIPFGTAGLRGLMGAGTNRMNRYMVELTAQALSDELLARSEKNAQKGVAISYDNRHGSEEFAWISARVFAGNGIRSYIYDDMRPTPLLSYTIRALGCASGIMVTASHNPKEYSGYKVYNELGSQILSEFANGIARRKNAIPSFDAVKIMDKQQAIEEGFIEVIGERMDREFMDQIKALSLLLPTQPKDITVVFTPLNGTGNRHMLPVLESMGFSSVYPVHEQMTKDPDFTTVPYPNPENPEAFALAVEYGKKHDADILLATDPDADRLAVMIQSKDSEYVLLTGNQTGALLISYILSSRRDCGKLPSNGAVVKSIVTSDFGDAIAKAYGVKTFEVLTGFKNICEKANEFEQTGEHTYLLGFEESIGYNAGTFVRDKDAISAGLLVCEACAYYKNHGLTLLDELQLLYEEYGFFRDDVINITLEGYKGQQLIEKTMKQWRKANIEQIDDARLIKQYDYDTKKLKNFQTGQVESIDTDRSNVLKYRFDNDCWYAIRPSGTEPKLKVYIGAKGDTDQTATNNLNAMKKAIQARLEQAGVL